MKLRLAVTSLLAAALTPSLASAQVTYEVTIKNLTKAQSFTPSLVVTHRNDIQLFEPATAADPNLEALAEEGSTSGFESALAGSSSVQDIKTTEGLLPAGGEITLTVEGNPKNLISVAAMLIPTNDAFYAIRGLRLPSKRGSITEFAYAWDSGTEVNDELCSSIPGPDFTECGGPGGGGAPAGGEEGFIHLHSGIKGVGDLNAMTRDFNNPVAVVKIRAISSSRSRRPKRKR